MPWTCHREPGGGYPVGADTPSSAPHPLTSFEPAAVDSRPAPGVGQAFRSGKLIEAIRLYRESTGVWLKAAKEFVDTLAFPGKQLFGKRDALLNNVDSLSVVSAPVLERPRQYS